MPGPASPGRLTNAAWSLGGHLQHSLKGLATQVGLVAQDNGAMSEPGQPPAPAGGHLDGTEHSQLRRWVNEADDGRPAEPVQFSVQSRLVRSAHHDGVYAAEALPLSQQGAQDSRGSPGQEQFGPAHSGGAAGRQQDHSKGERQRRNRGGHKAKVRPQNGNFNEKTASWWILRRV